jgi:hypothetical protein
MIVDRIVCHDYAFEDELIKAWRSKSLHSLDPMKPFSYHPFDLRQLVSFAEIARTGSFRQAAKTLHVAQPALSRQIKKLEAALGFLCSRGSLTGSVSRSRDEPWIFPPREANAVLYDELLSCCHRAGFSPNVIAEMTQRPRVISQVACGIGVATLVETLEHLCIGGTTDHRLVRPTPTVDGLLAFVHEIAVAFLRDLLVDPDKDFR